MKLCGVITGAQSRGEFYKDGTLLSSFSSVAFFGITNAGSNFGIFGGVKVVAANSYGSVGSIVALSAKLWGAAMSASEVAGVVSGTYNPSSALLGSWDFSKRSGNVVSDQTSHGAHLTLVYANNPGGPSSISPVYSLYACSIATGTPPSADGHTLYSLFRGSVNDWSVNPAAGAEKVTLIGIGRGGLLGTRNITSSLFVNTNVKSIARHLSDISCVGPIIVDSLINDSLTYAWYQDTSARDAFEKLLQTGDHALFERGDGTLEMQGRYAGLGNSGVDSFSNLLGMTYSLPLGSVRNEVQVRAQPKVVDIAVNTVAFVETGGVVIPASGFVSFGLTFVDPRDPTQRTAATSVTVPVNSTDYMTNAASTGTGSVTTALTSITAQVFAESIVISAFNGYSTNVFFTKFIVRGYPLLVRPELSAVAVNSQSRDDYGKLQHTVDNDFISEQEYAEEFATHIVESRANPQDQVSVSVKNQFPYQLSVELGDTQLLDEANTGINSLFQITGIEHDVTIAAGLEHVTTFTVRFYASKSFLVLDHPQMGVLDGDRVLAF